MAAEEIPRALEPFGQIDGTLARRYDGTGLGLTITKAFIEMHGGALTLDSEEGPRHHRHHPPARLALPPVESSAAARADADARRFRSGGAGRNFRQVSELIRQHVRLAQRCAAPRSRVRSNSVRA